MIPPVITEKKDGILVLTLNRPEKKNALTNEMYGILCDGFNVAQEDPKIRVVLLKGQGNAFTAGNDLMDFAAVNQGDIRVEDLNVVRLIPQIIDFEKPIVAAIRGPAVGFGTTLLPHCDIVVAGQSALFQFPFVRLGLTPEFASTLLLPAMAGRVKASHYLLLAERFGVEEAKDLGIVSLSCNDAEVEEQALAKCQALASLPPHAIRSTKRLLNPLSHREKLKEVILAEFQTFKDGLQSEEHMEAVIAFFEKRQPDFSRFE